MGGGRWYGTTMLGLIDTDTYFMIPSVIIIMYTNLSAVTMYLLTPLRVFPYLECCPFIPEGSVTPVTPFQVTGTWIDCLQV